MINDEIDRLRLAATTALLSGRRDVIIVSSVSCLYGIGNPEDFDKNVVEIKVGQKIARNVLLRQLVDSLYSRNETELGRGQFRVRGDTIDLYIAYEEIIIRIIFGETKLNPYLPSILQPWRRKTISKAIKSFRQIYLSLRKNARHRLSGKSKSIWDGKWKCFAMKGATLKQTDYMNA